MVQIFHNIFRYFNVLVYFLLCKSGKKQGISDRIRNDVFSICRKRIPDVELI